jgi:hypothetical protein
LIRLRATLAQRLARRLANERSAMTCGRSALSTPASEK